MADTRICTIAGCGKAVKKRSWCGAHYKRWLRHGDPMGGSSFRGIERPLCREGDCGKPYYRSGRCVAHYRRLRLHGEALAGRTPVGAPMAFFLEIVLKYEGDDCLIWPYAKSHNGYGRMTYNGRPRNVHRLACQHRHGPPPDLNYDAAHECGNGGGGCVNPRHTSWKTRAKNAADRERHGTLLKGSSHPFAKLREHDVLAIRSAQGNMTKRALAVRYGVGEGAIKAIWSRRTWAWLG